MKKTFRDVVILLGICTMAGLQTGHAALVVTNSTAAPTSYVVSSTVATGGLAWRDDTVNGRRDVGQSFYAGSGFTLDSITFQLASNAAPQAGALGAAFTLSVYEVASASAFPTAGTAISTQTGTLTGLTGTSADFSKYVTFDMDNIALTAGKYYTVMLAFDAVAVNRSLVWMVSGSSSTYPAGQCIITTDGTTFTANNDLLFYVTGVPEPGTISLLGAGAALFLLTSRRKARMC